VTEYLWFWLAWVFSFFTAVIFGISVHKKKLFAAGFLWIGIPLGGGRLIRIGLFSFDNPDKGRLRWSLSLFEMSFRSRTIRLMFPVPVQYLTEVQLDVNHRRINRNTSHAFKLLWCVYISACDPVRLPTYV
jgi:ACR3 family arsenite efflux pump ArsB